MQTAMMKTSVRASVARPAARASVKVLAFNKQAFNAAAVGIASLALTGSAFAGANVKLGADSGVRAMMARFSVFSLDSRRVSSIRVAFSVFVSYRDGARADGMHGVSMARGGRERHTRAGDRERGGCVWLRDVIALARIF